jgi:hypothetical protein
MPKKNKLPVKPGRAAKSDGPTPGITIADDVALPPYNPPRKPFVPTPGITLAEEDRGAVGSVFNPWTQSRLALWIWGLMSELAMSDFAWQQFGYAKCPKRGRLFKWTIPHQERVARVELTRELRVAAIASAFLAARRIVPKDAQLGTFAEVLRIELDGLWGDPHEIWRIFDFSTREESLDFYSSGITRYLGPASKSVASEFAARYAERLDREIDPFVILGAVKVFDSKRGILLKLLQDNIGTGTVIRDLEHPNDTIKVKAIRDVLEDLI